MPTIAKIRYEPKVFQPDVTYMDLPVGLHETALD